MKNKSNIKKKISIIIEVIILIIFLYSLILVIRSGKQKLTIKTISNFYSGSELEAVVQVTDKKTEEKLKSNITVELLNNDGKKVKGVKEKYKIEAGEDASISLPLPEDLESGKYNLKVTSKSGIFKEVKEVSVGITEGKATETIISLDKGIYKPGDEINYRALIISKKDNIPIASNEVTINIFDGNDNRVYSKNVTTSEFGIVSGNFKLSDVVNSGTYRLNVSTNSESVTKEFIVNPYVTPKFEVSVATDKDTYIVGEAAQITISAKYFFGEPVTNASISGIIDDEEFVGLTDENGNFTKELIVSEQGSHNISLSVEDSSNYFVEASKTFYGATDVFEIEILPEFNKIIKGLDNEIYVITKTADNKPVKTYMKVKIENISREIITDESGVGKIVLSSSDISGLYSMASLSIMAEDMSGQTVSKKADLEVVNNSGTIVKTDKVKYEENENIKVSLISSLDNQTNQSLYVFKGDELIKTITFDGKEIEFNLEGIYGLVDISIDPYTSGKSSSNIYYISKNNSDYNSKTIFIKPSGALNINIETDKDTYAPKETLNISFDVSDEQNEKTDTALLVSILDEAILSLTDNDLSIDNLKVALSDIKLSNGITAADLYSIVLEDSDTTTLNSILLKQNNNSSSKIKIYQTYEMETNKPITALIITSALIIIIIMHKFLKRFEKFRKVINSLGIALIDIIAICAIISVYCMPILIDIFYELDIQLLISFAICVVLSIVIYNLILYKEKIYIFNLVLELAIIPGVIGIVIALVSAGSEILAIAIVLALLLLLCVISAISRKKEISKFWNFVKEIILSFGKAIFFWAATTIICVFLDSPLGFLIVLAIYVLYEKIVLKKTNTKIKDGKIILNITGNELIGVYTGIVLVLIVVIFLNNIARNFAGSVEITDSISSEQMSASSDIPSDMMTFGATSINKGSNISDEINTATSSSDTDIFNIFENREKEEIEVIEQTEEDTSKEVKIEENVRNIFLESLAFIPEVVTNEGSANLEIPISDNITTWNIQTVGNSKDGKLGFASKNFKVFKEFFVDFSLPTNTVVTDNVSIPVTVYNYTENVLEVNLKVVENDWANIGEYEQVINVPANSTHMIYVPLEIIKAGNNTLRVESKAGDVSDIVEKSITTNINGMKKESVVSSGSMEKELEQDILFKDEAIQGTKKIKLKLYPSTISQIIENMESILKMPTGCFEQTSSSLYPDILALKYLKDNNLNSPEIEEKALQYISAGYQKLLTYEVSGTKGGYSLYGNEPAEPVITAFGLMEMQDLSEVYKVDENVIDNMKEYLFEEQNINGSFNYLSTYIGGATTTDDVAMNAYIIWALSEVCPKDERLEKSVDYLEGKLDNVEDNYTLALIANVFSNVNHKDTKKVIDKLMDKTVSVDNETAYVESITKDYWGTCGNNQNIQTSALTSLVLTKENSNGKTNSALINYIIKSKDTKGTWHNTQATILALKAINEYNENSDVTNQKITVSLNGENKEIEIGDNNLDLYELEFSNVDTENKISLSMKNGKIYYEIVKEYYQTYEEIEKQTLTDSKGKILVEQTINQDVNVNDIVTQNISLTNLSNDYISNTIVRINIPQGCSVVEESLVRLEYENKIEKYEYNYNTIDVYIRNYEDSEKIDLTINYRAEYPEQITGAAIRAYDYYNPEMEGIGMPLKINVK